MRSAQAAPPGNLDALVNKDLAAFRNADPLLVQAQALVQTYRERYPGLAASLAERAKLGRPGKLIPQQHQEVIRTVCDGPRQQPILPIVRDASLKHYSLTGALRRGISPRRSAYSGKSSRASVVVWACSA